LAPLPGRGILCANFLFLERSVSKAAEGPAAYPPARLAWTVWGLGAALYLYGFFQRVAPAVMTEELAQAFGLGAAALGNLSAFYFYSYVAMQVPTGILADRWGPRRLLAAGAVTAAGGSALFALAPNLAWAGAGRLLVGASVAVAFVGMLKLASRWFAPRQFALATGLALFAGILGAVFAGVPLRLLVGAFGWRPVMLAAAAVTLVVGAVIWLVVRDDPAERGYASHAHPQPASASGEGHPGILAGIREVFRYRNTWILALAPGGVVGCVLTFSGLWGIPFLTTHYGMPATKAAGVTSILLVAWAAGGPVIGAASDRLGRRKPLYVLGCALVLLCWSVVILVPRLPVPLLVGLLVVAGFASGGMIIGFAFAKESVPSRLAGTVSGVVNMGVMTGPMILQPAVGWALDRSASGQGPGGALTYDWAAYRAGFSLMLVWAALALLLVLFTRETSCRQNA
jgi:MFS family permease